MQFSCFIEVGRDNPYDPVSGKWNNADLVNLAVSEGTLSPGFNENTPSYSAVVDYDTTSIYVTPTAANDSSTIKVNGESVPSGHSSSPISFNFLAGSNTVTIVVTARDEITTNTYTITVIGRMIALAKTGQTLSYEPGDDGDLQSGVDWPNPRFTDHGNGTVTDNLTGLMWEKSPDSILKTWTDALSYANTLILGGYSDWRLPNINELESLIKANEYILATWLNTNGFSNVQSDRYWSSTTSHYVILAAYYVNFYDGWEGVWGKTSTYYVWSVRYEKVGSIGLHKTGQIISYEPGDDGDLQNGVDWPNLRFTENEDGTVSDNLTGLMWEKSPGTSLMTWTEALTNANNLTLGGYSDWRLPNRKELRSLINYGQADNSIWLNYQGFSNVYSEAYWSSNTLAGIAACKVWMESGLVYSENKYNYIYVMAVRSGK